MTTLTLVCLAVGSFFWVVNLVMDTRIDSDLSDEWRGVIVENVDFLAGMKRLAFYILNPHLKDAPTPEDPA